MGHQPSPTRAPSELDGRAVHWARRACLYEEVFEAISAAPLASASIAQVHEGVLRGGQRVAIKIVRPVRGNAAAAAPRLPPPRTRDIARDSPLLG
eukprot:683493-Prymnesium_polylepis.1